MSENFLTRKKLSEKQIQLSLSLKSVKNKKIRDYYAGLLLLLFPAAFSLFFLPLLRSPFPVLPFNGNDTISAEGILVSDSRLLDGGRRLYKVRLLSADSVNGIRASAAGIVKITGQGDSLYRGTTIIVEKPGFECAYVRSRLFFQPVPLIHAKRILFKSEPRISGIRRAALVKMVRAASFCDAGDGLSQALLTGNRDSLSPVLSENIRKSGCSHVLALSGMHMGILTVFIYFFLKKAAGPRISLYFALFFNLLFAVVAGMQAPLLRAFVLFLLASIARITGRSADPARLTAACFIAAVFISPDEAGELSFQYSFIAVAGMVFTGGYFYRLFTRLLPPFLSSALSCSVSAQLPSWLLSGAVFGEVYFSGIWASLIITPLVTVYMLAAFPCMIYALFAGPIPAPLTAVLKTLSVAIGETASFFSSIPPCRTGLFISALLIIINVFVIFSAMIFLPQNRYRNLIFPRRFR